MEKLAGTNAVREALRARRRQCRQILLAEGNAGGGAFGDIVLLAQRQKVPLRRATRMELDRLSEGAHHQGVLAEVSDYPYASMDEMFALAEARSERPFLLLLDVLQDPQNVGTLLRTAEAVGVHGVILPERRAAQITPAVSRASAGAVEHLRVAQVTNLARCLAELKERGLWVAGVEQDERAQDYRAVDLDLPLALVLGSEGQGMRRLVREACDWLLQIPMGGQVNSLNVAVAGSLVLYQAWHARQTAQL